MPSLSDFPADSAMRQLRNSNETPWKTNGEAAANPTANVSSASANKLPRWEYLFPFLFQKKNKVCWSSWKGLKDLLGYCTFLLCYKALGEAVKSLEGAIDQLRFSVFSHSPQVAEKKKKFQDSPCGENIMNMNSSVYSRILTNPGEAGSMSKPTM